MKIYNNLIELIGKTPLVNLNKFEKKNGLDSNIIAKVEYFNPSGSVKDRAALSMIEEAERTNLINKDTVIIEPTSGNTGIGLALICAIKGYRLILTMPETMSIERRNILKAYGAEVVLTPGNKGMNGSIQKAEELAKEMGNVFIPQQFNNPSNSAIHKITTAKEIINDLDGKVDIFIAGVGTGGTVTGVGEGLKEYNKNIKIVAVEPENSPILSGGKPGPHKIQGIGAGFIPEILDMNIIDEIFKAPNEESIEIMKKIVKLEGLFVGISSGAALYAAKEIGKREENKGKNIVVLLPDTGMRYLSSY
ncbi:cysteine synthase A [Clostridium tetani]|uniref:Cysteine synthase n=1 Tax=Clostridium tetani (strain Massachusetts / E88) TaxID=212717 RepID=Q895D3_CLOTE|nr:cysteine synthase A [Clostridium tetani]AAO35907.1 cysteine synthase A [Clostridium tetani E88]KGI38182.1 cysteine synthase [Clostridium tetani]KGI40057.1 cysteine synthase [Clostridium tetani ATCC 9441]KGI45010.1 cysteine synthase [Clostridium tetani]KHO32443.1 cysteine synthase [Clostridium tetani]